MRAVSLPELLQRLKPCWRFIRRPELAVCIATHFLLQHPGRLSAAGAESRLPQRRIIEPASDALDRHHPRDLVVAPTPRTPDRAYLVCHLTPPLGLSRGYARPSSACGWPAMWSTQFARFGAGQLETAEPQSRPGRSSGPPSARDAEIVGDVGALQVTAHSTSSTRASERAAVAWSIPSTMIPNTWSSEQSAWMAVIA